MSEYKKIYLSCFVEYKLFAEGTKSESKRPFICLENGTQILLYKKNDNPFENNFFQKYEGMKVSINGDFVNGVFEADLIELVLPEENNGETK